MKYRLWDICGCLFIIATLLGIGVAVNDLYKHSTPSQPFVYQYTYGNSVEVKKGFYRGFTCLVLEEYKTAVNCKVASIGGQTLSKEYQVTVHLDKGDITGSKNQ